MLPFISHLVHFILWLHYYRFPSLSSECAFCVLITFDSATSTSFMVYKSLFHIRPIRTLYCVRIGRPFFKRFVCEKQTFAQLSEMDLRIWRYNLARCEKLDENMASNGNISEQKQRKIQLKRRLIHSHINAHHLPNEMSQHCIFSLIRNEPCFNSIKMQFNWHRTKSVEHKNKRIKRYQYHSLNGSSLWTCACIECVHVSRIVARLAFY